MARVATATAATATHNVAATTTTATTTPTTTTTAPMVAIGYSGTTTSSVSEAGLRFLKDPEFPLCLNEPLDMFVQNALNGKAATTSLVLSDAGGPAAAVAAAAVDASDGSSGSGTEMDAAIRLDQLEIDLRKHAFQVLRKIDTKQKPFSPDAAAAVAADKMHVDHDYHADTVDDVLGEIGTFWTETVQVCMHLVHFDDTGSDERYKGMNARKIPLVLLEDILDSLPITLCQDFWERYVEPASDLLFSRILWDPQPSATPPPRPCWLPFLRLCNNLLRRSSPQWAARIMLTLATVYPLSEKSATKVWGSRNTEHVTLESRDEFEEQQQQQTETDEDGSVPDYSFYESFWSLQRDFSSPFVKNVASFLQRLRTLIQAVETGLKSQTLSSTSLPNAATDSSIALTPADVSDASTSKASLSPANYLTSSRLLSMQLSDPDFCLYVLTQFLIVAHHFSSEAPRVGDQLTDLQNRARHCLQRIAPPLGSDHLKAVDRILSTSETQWRKWKKNKCQPALDQDQIGAAAFKKKTSLARKRKRLADGGLLASKRDGIGGNLYNIKRKLAAADKEESAYTLLDLRKDIPAIADSMKKLQPSTATHLADYVDAMDPDSGIEADYHPKNNAFFHWQALRLLSDEQLEYFEYILPNGDFEPMIRQVYQVEKGIEIPGQAPVYEEMDQDKGEAEPEDSSTVATVLSVVAGDEGTAADNTTAGVTVPEEMLDEDPSPPSENDSSDKKLPVPGATVVIVAAPDVEMKNVDGPEEGEDEETSVVGKNSATVGQGPVKAEEKLTDGLYKSGQHTSGQEPRTETGAKAASRGGDNDAGLIADEPQAKRDSKNSSKRRRSRSRSIERDRVQLPEALPPPPQHEHNPPSPQHYRGGPPPSSVAASSPVSKASPQNKQARQQQSAQSSGGDFASRSNVRSVSRPKSPERDYSRGGSGVGAGHGTGKLDSDKPGPKGSLAASFPSPHRPENRNRNEFSRDQGGGGNVRGGPGGNDRNHDAHLEGGGGNGGLNSRGRGGGRDDRDDRQIRSLSRGPPMQSAPMPPSSGAGRDRGFEDRRSGGGGGDHRWQEPLPQRHPDDRRGGEDRRGEDWARGGAGAGGGGSGDRDGRSRVRPRQQRYNSNRR